MSVRHFLSLHRFDGVQRALGMLALIFTLTAFASRPAFHVTGRVSAAGGAPVPHASVAARDLQRRITTAGTTDAAGRYRLDGLAEGTYRLVVYADGMAETARRLVVRGFFADIIAKIGVPEVQDRLMAAIDEELELTITLEPASA